MKKNAFIFVALCLLSACGSKQKEVDEAGKPLVIDLHEAINNPVKQMLLSDAAEDIEIIPLETTSESALDLIRNLTSFDEGFIVYTQQDRCVFFDKNGKTQRIYHMQGQGPEEVIYPMGASYDERTKSIEIWGFATNTISSYGLDGTFRNKIRVYRDMSAIVADGDAREERIYRNVDGYHVMRRLLPAGSLDNPWQILIRDSANRKVAEITDPIALKYKDKSISNEEFGSISYMSAWCERTPVLSLYKGTRSIMFDGNDTIYRLATSKNKIYRRFLMKTSSEQIPIEQLHKLDMSDDYLNKYIRPRDLLESQDYMYIHCENKANAYLVRFNKETGEMFSFCVQGKNERSAVSGMMRRLIDRPEFTDDLTGGCSFFPNHTNDNEWIGVIPAERLLTEIDIEELEKKEVKLTHRKQQLINVLKNLKEDDNPVLMIVKLK